MPNYSDRNQSRRTSYEDNDQPRGRRGRSQQKPQPEVKETYHTLFALFGNDHANGRLQVDIRSFDSNDKGSIEDVLTIDEFLFFCDKLYYGEVKLTGSMWECDDKYASMSGNVRMTGTQISELKKEFAAQNQSQPAASSKPKYEVPVDDEVDEEPPLPVRTSKRPVKPAVVLDMQTEEVEETIPF